MIISRTPFRVSFFGGGTDYPDWYLKHGGAIIATTIDKYCHISCRYLPPFFEHRIRLVYSLIENCQNISEIKHPSIRACLQYLGLDRGLEIHHDGDLPARSGMGSSSAFTVGLLHALYGLIGKMPTRTELYQDAIHIEQSILKETVGSQDQVMTAQGGLNCVRFNTNGEIIIQPIVTTPERLEQLESHMMLFYTCIRRTAANVASSYVDKIEDRSRQLNVLRDLVDEAMEFFRNGDPIERFGELLHEGWLAKRSLSDKVSSPEIDQIYEAARRAGAIGGKITGAGGGGFLLIFAPPSRRKNIIDALKGTIHIPFKLDSSGTQIIYHDHDQNYLEAETRRNCDDSLVFKERVPAEAEGWN